MKTFYKFSILISLLFSYSAGYEKSDYALSIAQKLANPFQTAKELKEKNEKDKTEEYKKELEKYINEYKDIQNNYNLQIKKQLQALLTLYPYPFFDPENSIGNTYDKEGLFKEALRNLIYIKNNMEYYKKYDQKGYIFINKELKNKILKLPLLYRLAFYKKDIELYIKFYPVMVTDPTNFYEVTKPVLKKIEEIYLNNLEKIYKKFDKIINKPKKNSKKEILDILAKIDVLFRFLKDYSKDPFINNLYNRFRNILVSEYDFVLKNKQIRNITLKTIDYLENLILKTNLKKEYIKYKTLYYRYYYALERGRFIH